MTNGTFLRNGRHFLVLACMVCVLLWLPTTLTAQVTTARLEGIVKDASGAVVPGAAVMAKNEATGIPYESFSNETGLYVFAKLPPSTYTVSVELTGFKKYVNTRLKLEVGDTSTVNVMLSPGNITEEVVVSAAVGTIDLTSSVIGKTVGEKQIMDLPLNGRNPMNLFYLQAGTNPTQSLGTGIFKQQQTGNVDGLRVPQNNVTVEGVWAQDSLLDNGPGQTSIPVPLESVAEYKVVTSSASAEYGRGAGAQVQAIYRSGGNAMHGSAFEFNRNTLYNANNFFNNRQGTKRPTFLRNQYGASLGGPIIKNRTFYFMTYEGLIERQATIVNKNVYTSDLRNGTFRFNTGTGGNTVSIVDSKTGAPLIPASQIGTINILTVDPTRLGADSSGIVSKKLAKIPLPNNYDIGDGLNLAGYRYNSSLPDDIHQYVWKVDHKISDKHQFSITNGYSTEALAGVVDFSGFPANTTDEVRKSATLALISTLSPRWLNEARFGTQLRAWLYAQPNPDAFDHNGNFQLAGLGAGRGGDSNGNPLAVFLNQGAPTSTFNYVDNMTLIRKNHTFKWGVDIRAHRSNVDFGGDNYIPVLSTDNASYPATIPAQTGLTSTDRARSAQMVNDFTGAIGFIRQDMYANDPSKITPFTGPHRFWRAREYSYFFQDTWKVRENLTFNIGLRYEVYPAAYEDKGVFSQPIGGPAGMLGISGPTGQPTKTGAASNGGGDLWPTDWNNLAPNVGFTWDPFKSGKTSISANYRLAYDRVGLTQHLFLDFSNAGLSTTTTLNPLTRFSDPNIYKSVSGKDPILPIPVLPVFPNLPNLRSGSANTADPGMYVPYTGSWSFRIQREIMRNTTLQVSYVGNKGSGLQRALNFNQIEIRKNGFLTAFQAAQRNLTASGNPNTGEDIGVLKTLFAPLSGIPTSQYTNITQGQVAALANFIDTTTSGTGTRGGLVSQAGLAANFFRANPQFDTIYLVGNNSNSDYNSMKVEISRRFSAGLYFQANYTFGKGLTDYVGAQSQASPYRDNLNRQLDKTFSNFDATHIAIGNALYELPLGQNKRWGSNLNSWMNQLVGGWQVNGIFSSVSSPPLTVSSGYNNLVQNVASTADFTGSKDIFNKIIRGNTISTLTADDKALFKAPPAGSAGGTPLRSFRGAHYTNLDLSFFKSFGFNAWGEGQSLQFRFETFNSLNHTNFNPGSISTTMTSASFGVLTTARDPRIIQFALKFIF